MKKFIRKDGDIIIHRNDILKQVCERPIKKLTNKIKCFADHQDSISRITLKKGEYKVLESFKLISVENDFIVKETYFVRLIIGNAEQIIKTYSVTEKLIFQNGFDLGRILLNEKIRSYDKTKEIY
jgi:hypothetical protein